MSTVLANKICLNQIAILSFWPYQRQVHYLLERKFCLFYLNVTAKRETHICSNKYETGLVYTINHPVLTVPNFMEKSIDLQRVKAHFVVNRF